MFSNITANGIVNNAIGNTKSNVIRIKAAGAWDGVTINIFEWTGAEGSTPDMNASTWTLFASLTGDAIGSTGVAYNIGVDNYYYAYASGAGASTDVNLWIESAGDVI